MPQLAHLNGSKGDPKKAFFDPNNVIFSVGGGDSGIAKLIAINST